MNVCSEAPSPTMLQSVLAGRQANGYKQWDAWPRWLTVKCSKHITYPAAASACEKDSQRLRAMWISAEMEHDRWSAHHNVQSSGHSLQVK